MVEHGVNQFTRAGAMPTVLVVDDQDETRWMMAAVLEDAGYRVVSAADAFEAQLSDPEPSHFDLVVTDFQMPRMNGVELAGWIRSSCPKMPILIVTGDRAMLDKFTRSACIYPCLNKPFTSQQLLAKVREMMTAPPSSRPAA